MSMVFVHLAVYRLVVCNRESRDWNATSMTLTLHFSCISPSVFCFVMDLNLVVVLEILEKFHLTWTPGGAARSRSCVYYMDVLYSWCCSTRYADMKLYPISSADKSSQACISCLLTTPVCKYWLVWQVCVGWKIYKLCILTICCSVCKWNVELVDICWLLYLLVFKWICLWWM